MRIATWNIERLKHKTDIELINSTLDGLKADILVLTETDNRVAPVNYKYCIQTPKLTGIQPDQYLESGEQSYHLHQLRNHTTIRNV